MTEQLTVFFDQSRLGTLSLHGREDRYSVFARKLLTMINANIDRFLGIAKELPHLRL